MNSKWISAMVAGMAAGSFAMAASAAEGGRPLSAVLNGANEKPVAGDPDGGGSAKLTVNVGQSRICYEIQATNIAAATMAHIHKGAVGAAGPVVVPLATPDATGKSADCATADAALVKDILQNPAAYYVNVHNAEFKGGAVRGQLSK